MQLDLPLRFGGGELVVREHIRLNDRLVTYTIKRRRRRGSITLTIDEQGLRVGAPFQLSQRAIDQQLRRHAAWILKKIAEWEARRTPPRRWQDGEALMFLGEPLRLSLAPPPRATGRAGSLLLVGAGIPPDATEVAKQVMVWLCGEALACFRTRAAQYLPLLDVPVPEFRISNARTRWGSCHPEGRIHLNWRLIQMPLRLVDYVVAHELAHLREMNHSPRFWQTVARLIPDYAARRAEIRTENHRYLLA